MISVNHGNISFFFHSVRSRFKTKLEHLIAAMYDSNPLKLEKCHWITLYINMLDMK